MDELVDDDVRRPRRRQAVDVLEQDDAFTKTDVMLARGYVRSPETGAWTPKIETVIA